MKKQNYLKSVLFAVLMLVVILGFYTLRSGKAPQKDTSSLPAVQSVPPLQIDPTIALAPDQRPIAVMIENHPDSRPQSGLSQADIVYEALAEGGITRQMGIFQSQKVDSIGPVRSARPYYIDWAEELGAIYVHVGGSSDALEELRAGVPGVANVDQYFNGDYFKRITTRSAPHNVYTSTDKLLALVKDQGIKNSRNYQDYLFKDPAVPSTPVASTINIDFSLPAFAVKWTYDSKTNNYKRYVAGVAVVDAGNNKNILAKNVVVQKVKVTPVPGDPKLTVIIDTKSGGEAVIFQDGKEIKGTWKVVNGRTKYFDNVGQEIRFLRGQIWIEMVPLENTITTS